MIEVISSITGSKDTIRDNQPQSNAKFICYTDNMQMETKTWELRPAYDRFKDPRRNSRCGQGLPGASSDGPGLHRHGGQFRAVRDCRNGSGSILGARTHHQAIPAPVRG